jgi:hypothetical protein
MISFEEAKVIAESQIPSHHSFVEIIEKPYGWYFYSQSKAHIESGDFRHMEIGSGGFIVERVEGRIISFGSAYSREENFKIYEAGLAHKSYDLTVTKVRDLNSAIRLLKKLSMTFVKSEFEHNVEWKIPKEFNEKQLKEVLQNLPYTFTNQKFYFRYKEFEQMKNSKVLDYELKVNKN